MKEICFIKVDTCHLPNARKPSSFVSKAQKANDFVRWQARLVEFLLAVAEGEV
jgi:hypothetical protein